MVGQPGQGQSHQATLIKRQSKERNQKIAKKLLGLRKLMLIKTYRHKKIAFAKKFSLVHVKQLVSHLRKLLMSLSFTHTALVIRRTSS